MTWLHTTDCLSLQQETPRGRSNGPSCLSPHTAPAESHWTLKATPAGVPLWSIMTTDRTVLEINALQCITQNNLSFLSSLFPKDVRKSLNTFFILTACNSNISLFKSNNLAKNTLKPWQLKLQKKMNTKQSAIAIAKVCMCWERQMPQRQIWNHPAYHRRQVIQDRSLWNHF